MLVMGHNCLQRKSGKISLHPMIKPANPSDTLPIKLTFEMDGSAFCDKNVQISSLYCSFTVFYSFLGQYHKQKAHVLLGKIGQRL